MRQRPDDERHHHAIRVGEEAVTPGRRGLQPLELQQKSHPVGQGEHETRHDIALKPDLAQVRQEHQRHENNRCGHTEEHHPLGRHNTLHMFEHGVPRTPYGGIDEHHQTGDGSGYAYALMRGIIPASHVAVTLRLP